MLKFAIISEVLPAKGMARVKFDDLDIVSAPLHCSAPSSLKDQVQFPYQVNQHVWCMMDENLEQGVIGGAVYDEKNLPAGGDANIVRIKFDQGLEFAYDRSAKKLTISGTGDVEADITGDAQVSCLNAKVNAQVNVEVTAAVEIKLTAPVTEVMGVLKCAAILTTGAPGSPGLHIDDAGNVTTSGNIEAAGNVKQGTVVLGAHVHSGVTAGGGVSGPPTP